MSILLGYVAEVYRFLILYICADAIYYKLRFKIKEVEFRKSSHISLSIIFLSH